MATSILMSSVKRGHLTGRKHLYLIPEPYRAIRKIHLAQIPTPRNPELQLRYPAVGSLHLVMVVTVADINWIIGCESVMPSDHLRGASTSSQPSGSGPQHILPALRIWAARLVLIPQTGPANDAAWVLSSQSGTHHQGSQLSIEADISLEPVSFRDAQLAVVRISWPPSRAADVSTSEFEDD